MSTPLAERMRPSTLGGFSGQLHLLAPGKPLRQAIESGRLHSMILWGPPGTGKTTLARMVAHYTGSEFIKLSAVLAGVRDIRETVVRARQIRDSEHRGTILFLDEVHRFNKGQQDALLPHVEDGTVIFVGATTENPSFALNNALLSRARVYLLNALTTEDIEQILDRAMSDLENGVGVDGLVLPSVVRRQIAEAADGDARRALSLLELSVHLSDGNEIQTQTVKDAVGGQVRRFDKGGDIFYDQISALHKSVRGSAPDAALYWLARLIDGVAIPSTWHADWYASPARISAMLTPGHWS